MVSLYSVSTPKSFYRIAIAPGELWVRSRRWTRTKRELVMADVGRNVNLSTPIISVDIYAFNMYIIRVHNIRRQR